MAKLSEIMTIGATSGGTGALTWFMLLLQVLFIGLKIAKVITWHWWLVLLPFEIWGFIIIFAFIIVMFVLWRLHKKGLFW